MKHLILLMSFTFILSSCKESSNKTYADNFPTKESEAKLVEEVSKVKELAKKNNSYNPDIAFFIDMKIKSGKNRFFIFDLKKDSIIDAGLVAHGRGSDIGNDELFFSNVINSNSTSVGSYSIGKSYIGRFGKAYKLYGLDKTNSNAFDRFIVLHHYKDVPYDEQENPICNSLGCPMVNEKFFGRIERFIDNSESKILMNIYY